jgi:DNA-binding response OmpR family regulator
MRIPGTPDVAGFSIYVVDDAPYLTTFYTALLEAAGYRVRAFNDRAEALAALAMERKKPDLLITDYFGLSLPVDLFMHRCRVVHPALRILMASGCSQAEVQLSLSRPDRYIQKPFTPEEFQEEVRAVLAAQRAGSPFNR